MIFGYRHCSYYGESTNLKCETEGCVLKRRTIGHKKYEIRIDRHQLVKSEMVSVSKDFEILGPAISSANSTNKKGANYKKKKQRNSYTLVYREEMHNINDNHDGIKDQETGEVTILMKKINLYSRTYRTQSNKLSSYINARRPQISTIRESSFVTWQGVLSIVLGFLSVMVCLLAGQFWDPTGDDKLHRDRRIRQNRKYDPINGSRRSDKKY